MSCHEIAISSNPVTAVMPDITKYCFGVAVICSFIINLLCAQRQRSPDGALCATYGATHCSERFSLTVNVMKTFSKLLYC